MTKLNLFTSDLIIDAERVDVEKDFAERAEELAESFLEDFDWFNRKTLRKSGNNPLQNYSFANKEYVEKVCRDYSRKAKLGYIDATSCVKGLFLQSLYDTVSNDFLINKYVDNLYKEKFLLSFGGDIFGTDLDYSIEIENTPIRLKPSRAPYFCFTSGNFGKRNKHIKIVNPFVHDEEIWKSLTVCGTLDPLTRSMWPNVLAFIDCYTTNVYAHQDPSNTKVPNSFLIDSLAHIWVATEGNIEIYPILAGKGGVQWFI